MSSNEGKVAVDLTAGIVGRWKETYQWIPIFGALATVAMAFSAGANNLTAPFSTPVGSGALTLLKASIIACLIYVPGAAFTSKSTVDSLFSDFLKESQPDAGFLMWSLVVALITAAIWLAVATYWELPVSSQQSIQSALLGTILVTEGFGYIPLWNKSENHNFNGGGLLWISLEWTVAPLIACLCSYIFFKLLRAFLLRSEDAEKRILIFLPIDYGISTGLLCLFVIFQINGNIIFINTWLAIVTVLVATLVGTILSLVVIVSLTIKKSNDIPNCKSNKKSRSIDHQCIEIQDKTSSIKDDEKNHEDIEEMLRDFMQTRVLETVYEEEERSWDSPLPDKIHDSQQQIQDFQQTQSVTQKSSTGQLTQFKQLLESTPNRLVQARNFQRIEKRSLTSDASTYIRKFAVSIIRPVIEYDRRTLVRHALAEKYDEMEDFFSFPHLLASCIFAYVYSVSEVAAIASPYAAILDVFDHRIKYLRNGEDVEYVHVKWWFRAISGLVAAMGFFLCGWRLTRCLGGKLTYMSNSRGLASQLSSVTAVMMVTRMNLPASSIHAFVGSLLGVGMVDDIRNVNWKLVLKFLGGWILTVIFSCGIAYVIFSASVHSPGYVVP
ncbi:PREDICTED: sodium-dependent phosphate transporter 1-like [Populus euphratica]|uniref:Phosphate transporter n=1 Tax=Populus euphratica TaxID=75702 RepID=A0AAJ6SVF6_POPEU|nr:PREDICTED: sodium-dependent phosphate transporter 1-like [Populus euphratica]